MWYLAMQTFVLLALTAVVFFGLGYVFHQRFARAKVVVSEQPPAHPPHPHRSAEADAELQELRNRLLEKERDFAELLANVPPPGQSPPPVESDHVRELEAELRKMRIAFEDQTRLTTALDQQNQDLERQVKELDALQFPQLAKEPEPVAPAPPPEPILIPDPALLQKLEVLTAELERKNAQHESMRAKVEELETKLYESEYSLQLAQTAQKQEQEEMQSASEAIWEEVQLDLQEPVVAEVIEPRSNINAQMDKIFEKIRALEASFESMREENEKALMSALEIAKTVEKAEPAPPLSWDPSPGMQTLAVERDQAVAALWQAEKEEQDAEKERLRRSVESLKKTLDGKEKSLEELGGQLASLSDKLDPKLTGPDNLELIKGIGPYTRKLLDKEFKIRTYEQLANLDKTTIQKISDRLFFSDKIERENWIGQAQELHQKKYG